MKTNKIKQSVEEKFIRSMQFSLATYYRDTMSENIKRGIAKKKLQVEKITNK